MRVTAWPTVLVLVCACSSADESSDPTPTGVVDPTSGGLGETGSDSNSTRGSSGGPQTTSGDPSGATSSGGSESTGPGPGSTSLFPGESSTGEPIPPPFTPGNIFVVGFNDRMVFEYDSALQPVGSWTHPSFDGVEGPAGMVFDHRGHLVVASYDQFCVFSGSGQEEVCYPKTTAQRTENVIFDIDRNLYTTTSTGGTDEIHKYDEDYTYLTTFTLPTGQLTGITCDPAGDLFVASQISAATSTIYKVGTNLQVLDSFDVAGNAEGLQYTADDDLLVALSAGAGIARVVPMSPTALLSSIVEPGLLWPVPLTVDEMGNIYTGDFEDGSGTGASDLYVFDPMGNILASRTPSELHGPFGLVVAGVSLPCGAVPPG